MWFGEPHPFPERGSPTGLSASGQQRYKGWSCIGHTPTKTLQHFYFSLASCSQRQTTVFILNALTYSCSEGHNNAALTTFYDQHTTFTGLLNNVSSTAYCMKLHLNGGEKKKKERKKEKRKEKEGKKKCQSLNHDRNFGQSEYKNDNLMFTFFYILKNEFLESHGDVGINVMLL